MCRGVETFKSLWCEFFDGLVVDLPNGGKTRLPKVDDLEKKYKRKWREDSGENQFFCRRNRIIKRIKQEVSETNPVQDVLQRYDLLKSTKDVSFDWIAKHMDSFFE